MNQDPWAQILNDFFSELKNQATIKKVEKKYHVNINGSDSEMFSWCFKTLETWQGVESIGIGEFMFDKKSDAEKFITLYNLVWAQQ